MRILAEDNLLTYTRYVFEELNNRPFARSEHHRIICRALERVYNGECRRLIINIPPRHSKTELAVINFTSWCYAKEPACRFMHLSYSNDLVIRNSQSIQNTMQTEIYRSLFPESALADKRIKSNHWKTTAGGEFYAASTGGQITGFGAGVVDAADDSKEVDKAITEFEADSRHKFMGAIIIDDAIKPSDGLSDTVRENINQRFENTIRSRANSVNTPIIIIMQRIHEHDLCGYLLELEPDEWEVLSLPAISQDENGNDVALWPGKMPLAELYRTRNADSYVFETQYQQDPTPREGLMYEYGFKEYEILPDDKDAVKKNVTDTADTGSDYFCSICYLETKTAMYVTDILFTQKNTDYSEPKCAQMLNADGTEMALFEANNGGRSIAKAVKENCRKAGNLNTRFITFPQTKDKEARIRLAAPAAQNTILFPKGWNKRWPEFYNQLTKHRYINSFNSHDDAADTASLMVENFNKKFNNFIAL